MCRNDEGAREKAKEGAAVSDYSRCKDCNATVMWRTTARGKRIALNPLPQLRAVRLTEDQVSIVHTYDLHATTCTKKDIRHDPPQRRSRANVHPGG